MNEKIEKIVKVIDSCKTNKHFNSVYNWLLGIEYNLTIVERYLLIKYFFSRIDNEISKGELEILRIRRGLDKMQVPKPIKG